MGRGIQNTHVARFLSGLPTTFNGVKSQILGSKDLLSTSKVFGRLRQSSLSDSSTVTSTHNDKSAFIKSKGVVDFLEVEFMEIVIKGQVSVEGVILGNGIIVK